jgi:hypothetical protein
LGFNFQIPNSKSQINSKHQCSNDQNNFACDFEFGSLEIICYLACLREAASAEAGAWDLVLAPDSKNLQGSISLADP